VKLRSGKDGEADEASVSLIDGVEILGHRPLAACTSGVLHCAPEHLGARRPRAPAAENHGQGDSGRRHLAGGQGHDAGIVGTGQGESISGMSGSSVMEGEEFLGRSRACLTPTFTSPRVAPPEPRCSAGVGRAACAEGVSAVPIFLEGKRAWKGRPEGDGSDNEGLRSLGRVEIRESLGRREARGLAEPEPVKEIAQPLPTGVDGHATTSAAAAAAQQNVDLKHPPHQGRPRESSQSSGTGGRDRSGALEAKGLAPVHRRARRRRPRRRRPGVSASAAS
jgi:hypothetical protein